MNSNMLDRHSVILDRHSIDISLVRDELIKTNERVAAIEGRKRISRTTKNLGIDTRQFLLDVIDKHDKPN